MTVPPVFVAQPGFLRTKAKGRLRGGPSNRQAQGLNCRLRSKMRSFSKTSNKICRT